MRTVKAGRENIFGEICGGDWGGWVMVNRAREIGMVVVVIGESFGGLPFRRMSASDEVSHFAKT